MKKNKLSLSIIRIAVLSFMLGIGMFFSSSVNAATITYNAVSGDWTDAQWTPQAPVAGDNIVIPIGAIVTVSTDLSATKFNSLAISGKLIVSASGKLNIEQATTINPLVNITGGEIQNSGVFTIKLMNATSGNSPIYFANGIQSPVTNAIFNNTGTLNVDLLSSTGHSNASRLFFFNQSTTGTTAQFVINGTVNLINVTATARIFEVGAGSAELDGIQTFGSVVSPLNARFIHMGASGTLTFPPTANINVYSGFVNANGTITMSNTGFDGTIVNKGTLALHGGSTVTGYGIYVNPGTAAKTSTFTNEGSLTVDGNFPTGSLYLSGATATSVGVVNNQSGAIMNISNTNASGTAIRAGMLALSTFNNAGTLTLSTTLDKNMMFGSLNATLTNTGTVNVDKGITGYTANAAACVINNNVGGVFNFNVASNSLTAIDATNKITFNNNGGKVTGRGVFGAGKFVPSTGTLSPGGDTGIGSFTFSDPSLTLTGTCNMNVNGIATAGTDFDQIVSTGTLDVAGVSLTMTVGGGYTPANADVVPLFSATSRTGNFSAITAPSKWVSNYTATTANLLYDTSTGMESKASFNGGVYTKDQNIIVTLGADASVQLQVIDMIGRLVKQTTLTSKNNTVHAANLKGVYIVRLIGTSENYTQKINL